MAETFTPAGPGLDTLTIDDGRKLAYRNHGESQVRCDDPEIASFPTGVLCYDTGKNDWADAPAKPSGNAALDLRITALENAVFGSGADDTGGPA